MCLYQRACCIAYHVPMLWVVLWCRWWQGTQQKGFLAGEEYSEGTKACWIARLLRFPFNSLYILGALQTVKLPCALSSCVDLGQVEGTGDGDVPAHERFGGRRLTLRCRSVPSELERTCLRGKSRTGSLWRWCQGGAGWMGDFMEPGQQALYQVEHRGAVRVFGVSSLWGIRASGMGHIVSTTYQELVSVF